VIDIDIRLGKNVGIPMGINWDPSVVGTCMSLTAINTPLLMART